MKNMHSKHSQSGAALIVGLLLLVVITVLAVSGMNTATTELAMARNDQNHENAFQAAETGIETALDRPVFETEVDTRVVTVISAHEEVEAIIRYERPHPVTDRAFSMGVGSGFSALHFNATSTASSKRIVGGGDTDRDANAVHTQAFYVVGPPVDSGF